MSDLMAKLAAPFGANDLEWKPQTIGVSQGKPWCQIVPYVAARAVYQRLDDVTCPKCDEPRKRRIG